MFLEFYAADWSEIGTKLERKKEISEITRIQEKVLDKSRHLSDCCAAEIVSWAARRETTREEDQSYALMGLLGVNMPLLYGEGSGKAWVRLQKEVLTTYEDHSLFLWAVGTKSLYERTSYKVRWTIGDMALLAPGLEYFDPPEEVAKYDYSRLVVGTPNTYWHCGTRRSAESGDLIAVVGNQEVYINLWTIDLRKSQIKETQAFLPKFPESATHAAVLNLYVEPSGDTPARSWLLDPVRICIPLEEIDNLSTVFERPQGTKLRDAVEVNAGDLDGLQFRRIFVQRHLSRPGFKVFPGNYSLLISRSSFTLDGFNSPDAEFEFLSSGEMQVHAKWTFREIIHARPIQLFFFLTRQDYLSWSLRIDIFPSIGSHPGFRLTAKQMPRSEWIDQSNSSKRRGEFDGLPHWNKFGELATRAETQDRVSISLGEDMMAKVVVRRLPDYERKLGEYGTFRYSMKLMFLKNGEDCSPETSSDTGPTDFWSPIRN
jgi:hypothetical protein